MLEKLACKLGHKDETPNLELAEYLSKNKDIIRIKEIVDGFKSKDKEVASDCIKVLYEIGERNPMLITDYVNDFIAALNSKNNRLVWGSMMALAKIAEYVAEPIFAKLPEIKAAYIAGSVITIDYSISVFAKLCSVDEKYEKTIMPILINHFEKCGFREIPQHAERVAVCFNNRNAKKFIEVFEKRLSGLTPAGQTRMNKLLKKIKNSN